MKSQSQDFVVQAWKKQLDNGLLVIETIIEGGIKLSEAQLKAAAGVHAEAEATRKAISAATDPAQVFSLQAQWARASLDASAAYWRSLHEIVVRSSGGVVSCLCGQAPGLEADRSKNAFVAMMDSTYRQWLDGARQFYSQPMVAPETKAKARAAA